VGIRTSVAEVLALVGDTSLDDEFVIGLIADASQWVDRNLVGACSQQTAESLEQVERYLAAHLITRGGPEGSTGPLKSSTRDVISETYDTGNVDTDAAKRFAQIAASFDPCGIVAEKWLGKLRPRALFARGYADV